ncbi:hypothetical protein ACA910_020298 [Epithemia clementina (nom. ined.)]
MGNCVPATKGELGEELFERLDQRLQDNEERIENRLQELLENRLQDNNNKLLELLENRLQDNNKELLKLLEKRLQDNNKDNEERLEKRIQELLEKRLQDNEERLDNRLQELEKRLQDNNKDNEERLEKRIQELLEKRLQDLEFQIQFQGGIYYRKFKSIWKSESKEFQGAAVEWKDLRQKDKVTLQYYKYPSKRENFRYCKGDFPSTNLFPPKNKSMANLIPSDASCSLAWLRALSIVTGIDVGKNIPVRHLSLLEFVEGSVNQVDGQRTRRVADPLKTWKWNFIMLPDDHYKYFDQVSTIRQLIVTPIWDPKKEWKPGTGYKVMVSADPESYKWLLGTDKIKQQQLKWFGTGTSAELQTATDFLALTVRALADMLVQHGKDDLETPFAEDVAGDAEHGKESHDDDLKKSYVQRVFESIDGAIPSDLLSPTRNSSTKDDSTQQSGKTSGKSHSKWAMNKAEAFRNKVEKLLKVTKGLKAIKIPVPRNTTSEDEDEDEFVKPVVTVDLGIYFGGKDDLIPDPFLVVLKAAASWSVYTNQRLLPACEVSSTNDGRLQLGSHGSMSSISDNMRPLEIVCSPASISQREDDDSVMSLSESITGSPGDGLFDIVDCMEQMPAVTPCSSQLVEPAVVTP